MANQSTFLINANDYGEGVVREVSETNIKDNTQYITIDDNHYANLNRQRKESTIEISFANESPLFILMNQLVDDKNGSFSKTLDTNAKAFGGNLMIEVINQDDKKMHRKYKICEVQKIEPSAAMMNTDGNVDACFSKATIVVIKQPVVIYDK